MTRKNDRKGRKHESNGGSAGPLYFRGFLGEMRSVGSIRDSFWGLTETMAVAEPQYVSPEPKVDAPKIAPQAIPAASVTSAPVSAE